eukprot:TRINITY_DN465_c0_g1_i4.p1 TRINITY_DN465_c0_g1~~TRINITY_DN465_c0_g1_i4.p1  ORF type:complete len:109 (+),score=41.22 TRINITY_DN465_c0_g1_i4:199-525(+)
MDHYFQEINQLINKKKEYEVQVNSTKEPRLINHYHQMLVNVNKQIDENWEQFFIYKRRYNTNLRKKEEECFFTKRYLDLIIEKYGRRKANDLLAILGEEDICGFWTKR